MSKRKPSKQDQILKLLGDIHEELWKLNLSERIPGMVREIDLLKGNFTEEEKRSKLLINFLGLEYFEERGFKKKK